ncbi:TPA: hypothetical protein NVL70_002816 [Enterobacter hormaechei subsp. xiangfangensis]|nr:hypothetical protein [Enterobacter hormaechei subsp. xiangfangensis]
MTTITREEAHAVSDLKAGYTLGHVDVAILQRLARIALASLEAEPVAEVCEVFTLRYIGHGPAPKSGVHIGDRLYTAPPAPVSVPEWTNDQCLEFLSIAFRHAEIKGDLELDDIRLGVKMVNGSRAAMLQGAEPDFREISNSSTKHFRENAETSTKCWCRTCRPVTFSDSHFVVCPECGNKRCPHANDHRHACTGSNEPGQEGSAYPAAPQQEVK